MEIRFIKFLLEEISRGIGTYLVFFIKTRYKTYFFTLKITMWVFANFQNTVNILKYV